MTNQKMVKRYEILESSTVGISTGHVGYLSEPPYSPGNDYPEYTFGSDTIEENVNHAYDGIRNALHLLQLDEENYGQKNWNPLGQIIHPGQTVVLKPNWVRDFRETQTNHEDCLITHGSIIRAALDYVYIALKGKGRIIVADAPQEDANFDEIQRITEMNRIQEFYRRHSNLELEVYDLRSEKTRTVDGVTVGYDQLSGDPLGYVRVNLDDYSMFAEIENVCHLVYGSDYDTREIRRHHTGGVHEYLISRTIMEADCIINLPKLKTHKKTGLTICMKNLVGINGNKNWLPHHRLGTPSQGGDQFADNGLKNKIERHTMACFRGIFPLLGPLRSVIAKPLKAVGQSIFGNTNTDTIRSGNWYGNDTTWRMVADLNRILIYADKNGLIKDTPARRIFSIADGIVCGEGNGPLDPIPKSLGVIVAGMNPVAVDLTCARIMSFDYTKMPLLYRALDSNYYLPLIEFGYNEVICRSNTQRLGCPLDQFDELIMPFKPHFGWQGHIELNLTKAPAI